MGNLCAYAAFKRGVEARKFTPSQTSEADCLIMRLAVFVPAVLMVQASALMMPLAPRGGAVRLGAPRLAGPPAEDTSSGIQVSLRDPETNRSLCRVKVPQLTATRRSRCSIAGWVALWGREASARRVDAEESL